ncbi:MAG: nucleoside triphosphate pyrophosphatase [Actinomycetes bacterium]|jgi:septum formation protein
MSTRRVILASASPSRKRLLESSGITPEIFVSGVDEEDPDLLALKPSEMVIALAIMKAHTVRQNHPVGDNALVIGCDSTFEFNGESLGKPLTRDAAIARAKMMRGKSGYLHTGHSVIDTAQDIEVSDISTSKVTFVDMTDREIEEYVDSGEPLQVAGGFTLDGRSAPFISHIDGDPSGIIGLSLPTLRKIMINLGLEWGDLL